MKLITDWLIKVAYEDGSTEVLVDMPDCVASEIDLWLGEIEQER